MLAAVIAIWTVWPLWYVVRSVVRVMLRSVWLHQPAFEEGEGSGLPPGVGDEPGPGVGLWRPFGLGTPPGPPAPWGALRWSAAGITSWPTTRLALSRESESGSRTEGAKSWRVTASRPARPGLA